MTRRLVKWKVNFIIPEPQNRLLWLYKFTSYSPEWALTPTFSPSITYVAKKKKKEAPIPKKSRTRKIKNNCCKKCSESHSLIVWKHDFCLYKNTMINQPFPKVSWSKTGFQLARARWKTTVSKDKDIVGHDSDHSVDGSWFENDKMMCSERDENRCVFFPRAGLKNNNDNNNKNDALSQYTCSLDPTVTAHAGSVPP